MSQPTLPHIDTSDSIWLPRQSSNIAVDTDYAYYVTLWICVFFFVIVIGAMIIFAIKYKRKSDDERTSPVDHNFRLEVIWSTIPSGLLVWLFVLGLKGYANAEVAPNEAFEIKVTGQMWAWSFEYPDGLHTDELYVPADRPVKLLMSSKDVIHAFFVPEFRVKQDVVPGMYSTLWFTPKLPADGKAIDTAIECAEYCGDGHSRMLNTVHILPGADFDKAYGLDFEDPNHPLNPSERGQRKYNALCSSCHSLDGTRITGPTWKGMWGRSEKLEDGRTITVDENYVRKSILDPQADIVETYPHTMPTFSGQVSDKDIDGIIAFIKEQK